MASEVTTLKYIDDFGLQLKQIAHVNILESKEDEDVNSHFLQYFKDLWIASKIGSEF